MHDNAIQERTRLRLLEETQQQEQRAHDLELAAKQRRATQTAELAAAEAQQKADLSLVSRKALLQEIPSELRPGVALGISGSPPEI